MEKLPAHVAAALDRFKTEFDYGHGRTARDRCRCSIDEELGEFYECPACSQRALELARQMLEESRQD